LTRSPAGRVTTGICDNVVDRLRRSTTVNFNVVENDSDEIETSVIVKENPRHETKAGLKEATLT